MIHTSYLKKALTPHLVERTCNKVIKDLEPIRDTFGAIGFIGISGALIAPIIANRLRCKLIVFRKIEEACHSPYKVEGAIYDNFILIDDFVHWGETVGKVCRTSKVYDMKLRGVYLYNQGTTKRSALRGRISKELPDKAWIGTIKHGIFRK